MKNRGLVYGVGINDYHLSLHVKGKPLKEYQLWINVLERSFSKKYKEKRPSYIDVTCSDRWLSLSGFIEDIRSLENFDKYGTQEERWCLDKDILVKGNKLYSKDTCCFVPARVNNLFTKSNKIRGEYPIGVQKVDYSKYRKGRKIGKPFRVQLWIDGKVRSCGMYATSDEAFNVYKELKEGEILRVANLYRGVIADNVYNALLNYKVDYND